MSTDESAGFHTRAIHAAQEPDPATGAVSVPIYQTSTFAFSSTVQGAARFSGKEEGYIYTRLGNPTIQRLEESVAGMEGGYRGLATATGMAAVSAVYLALLGQGRHVVCSRSVYGPSRVILENHFARFGVAADFVATERPGAIAAAMRPETSLVYVETPANPTIDITDIAAAAEAAHAGGALLCVDNTFCSPFLQRPLEHGADVVVHSMTKFLNGHADVVAGMIVVRDEQTLGRIRPVVLNFGGTMDPHQAWLVLRGIKTLPMRMERAQANAMALAGMLEAHPKVARVLYPGLESHPARELVRRQMDGPGALLSLEMKGGYEAGRALLDGVRLMTLAVSLGGIETLIQHPASMTHAGMSPEHRAQAGISEGLVRLSVGCEDLADLRADLERALELVAVRQ